MKFHVVGCAGSGMSGVARYFHEAGHVVSGCDASPSSVLDELEALGISVCVGHDPAHVANVDVVVASPAVRADAPELEAAETVWDRATLLTSLAQGHRTIGVAGTHGKTTTTSMLAHIASAAGARPSWLCGQPIRGLGANGHFDGEDLILETDESFGTFRLLAPNALGVLNVEPDHLDYYGTVEAMEQAYRDLAERTTGPLVASSGHGAAILRQVRPDLVEVGDGPSASVVVEGRGTQLRLRGALTLEVELRVWGAHNRQNAALAAVLAAEVGYDDTAIVRGLAAFRGAPRRFEIRGGLPGRIVVDDYAHLPSEIATTLAAARQWGAGRVVALFQPHRVTRTVNLGASFGPAFIGADALIVTDLYDAGEPNPEHVTGERIAEAARAAGVPTTYVAAWREAGDLARLVSAAGDTVVVMGAGDVGGVCDAWERGR